MPDARVVLYKRWKLREGTDIEQVVGIVRDAIVPMYLRLSEDVVLGLEHDVVSESVLAIQRWPSRAALDQAMRGPGFKRWWSEYGPVLKSWDSMLVLDSEWDTVELIS